MFDFGFSELVVVFVVALVVLGPTRLPGLVRKVGRWIGKARAMANDFRQQLENEVNLDELNRMTERQSQQRTASTPDSAVPPEASAETPVDAGLSGTGYPYGTPTDVGSAEAHPAAAPSPGDDTYSHAHAEGAAPQPWSPEAEATPDDHIAAAEAAPADDSHTIDPAAPGSDKQGA